MARSEAMPTDEASFAQSTDTSAPSGSDPLRSCPVNPPAYLLAVLSLIYMSSLVDRTILNIVAQAIKVDLGLSDTQIGLLGGLAFSALYAVLGIPCARLTERKNRVTILAVAVAIWSFMTTMCGFAMNFWQLAIARAGVGIGEAACTPCAHSMIGDSFPHDRRATAISIYSLAIPLGTLVGVLGGAWLVEHYSWRAAFIAAGLPGLLIAVLTKLTLKDPVRGAFGAAPPKNPPPISAVLRQLWVRPTFRNLLIGVTGSTLVNAGISAFIAPYLLRSPFDVGLTQTALAIAFLGGVAAFLGTLVGGPLGDLLARRDVRYLLMVSSLGFLIAAPCWIAAFFSPNLAGFLVCAAFAQILAAVYVGPTFGVLHNMVETRMRATAVAIVFVCTSLLGIGAGPAVMGKISDVAAEIYFDGNYGGLCSSAMDMARAACRDASFEGLRFALAVGGLLHLVPAFFYFRASRTTKQDMLEE